ncbi:GNAT family N-acetyltransferase [Paludicola sp. MB14-C6]|uniref:GNAT family N-acetyltransferase n=1 Tax=Paludihabitans sp. MB14-C6 TaxID=3070656 RepID=UPI0027DB721F|nr:GNAT family N-acetyltransferase [Paludicola sp. MB14-C6]WMJ24363.1 GNAT family N-acetyltransferase [Paludicola sp. MB14-C6]
MTNKDVMSIALKQSAIDSNCFADDFISCKNKVVLSKENPNARKYLKLPFLCDFTSYGNNIVASVSEEFRDIATEYINKFSIEHCFETPNLHWLIDKIKPYNANICFMAEYFLPNVDHFPTLKCKFETRVLYENDFENLYIPQWSNALCKERKQLDKLGVGAFHNGKLIGLAGCSADCNAMWQIGIDVLPDYRKQGVASSITNQLAHEIMKRGIVPFYCCAWSNIKSVRNAIRSGFLPSWVQMTIKPNDFIADMNQ